jgi:hypothetical protein
VQRSKQEIEAQLASYLCLLIYVTLSISCYANEGEIEGFASQLRTKSKHKATFGYHKHQRCLKEMLAYEYKQA